MSETRTIHYNFNAVDLATLKDHCGTDALFDALGYLTQWNFTFSHVYISIRGDDELVACYYTSKDTRERPGYVIGAIFNEDTKKFSFHS